MPLIEASDARTTAERAFLEPVRTVLCIDDRFPTYGVPAGDGWDGARARALWQWFVDRGLLCGIDNRVRWEDPAAKSRLGSAELIVLDYHLEPGGGADPEPALAVIERLAAEPYPNLVVVYTQDPDLTAVHRTIAARLRGEVELGPLRERLLTRPGGGAAVDALDEWSPGPSRSGRPAPRLAAATLHARLGGARREAIVLARKEIEEELGVALSGVPTGMLGALAEYALASDLREALGAPPVAPGSEPRRVSLSPLREEPLWLYCGNAFIVLVGKEENDVNEADRILAAIREGLARWNPPPLLQALAHGRALIQREGIHGAELCLPDAKLRAGLRYLTLRAAPDERREELLRTWNVLSERLTERVAAELLPFLDKVIGGGGSDDPVPPPEALEGARRLEGLAENDDAQAVLHALNAFLCSGPYAGRHVTTGTIFRSTDEHPEYWVCLSPACDLVPREPMGPYVWQRSLHPLRPMVAARLEKLSGDAARAALERAHLARHIFLAVPAGDHWPPDSLTLRVAALDDADVLALESFILANEGRTADRGKFIAHRVKKSAVDGGPPTLEQQELQAVAQLRRPYSERLLQQAGQHLSRIGVDFERPPDAAPHEAAATAAAPAENN